MRIIPVIDLLNGHVVHAWRGERQRYQPIRSALCNSSAPLEIVHALLELYPFETLYIADLDAIQRRGNNQGIIAAIHERYPALTVWLDSGFSQVSELPQRQLPGIRFVLGSESISGYNEYLGLADACRQQHVLSLDFSIQGFQGPPRLISHREHWPEEVIVMTLDRVGSNLGPDTNRLTDVMTQSPARQIIAAGGIRGINDLLMLKNLEVGSALVATALHGGQISRSQIEAVHSL